MSVLVIFGPPMIHNDTVTMLWGCLTSYTASAELFYVFTAALSLL
jgi:hypothetical protein